MSTPIRELMEKNRQLEAELEGVNELARKAIGLLERHYPGQALEALYQIFETGEIGDRYV